MGSGGGQSEGPDNAVSLGIALLGMLVAVVAGVILGIGILYYLIIEKLVTVPW